MTKPPSFGEQLVVESARLAKLSIEKVPGALALAAPGRAQPGLRHFRRTSNIDSLVIHPLPLPMPPLVPWPRSMASPRRIAGRRIVNAACCPRYVCGAGFLTTPEDCVGSLGSDSVARHECADLQHERAPARGSAGAASGGDCGAELGQRPERMDNIFCIQNGSKSSSSSGLPRSAGTSPLLAASRKGSGTPRLTGRACRVGSGCL